MARTTLPGGTVHKMPVDLRKALTTAADARAAWHDITPLARNEWICMVTEAKQAATRERRIAKAIDQLSRGQRRPCCWPGCSHRVRDGT
jgi:uncharacterized protein YdeI (YjbR/CyaY-like superfamily)